MGTYNFKVKGENDLMVGLHVVEGDEFESIEQMIQKSIIASHDVDVIVNFGFLNEEGTRIMLYIYVNSLPLEQLIIETVDDKYVAKGGANFNWYSFPYGKVVPSQK
ncbi:hypothetical protein [Bacillus pretiosus]|uniref:hypothetical protein n=1 Tax=Bacillus pretiosus TaxID=2983392 RepID=UPI003D652803